ncbi:aminoglycoside phosphotransferase family protein [candidate division KSB1 bacterium]|nr:aminoglycoside phosphotransferase family protein [candidate division KSB1 bacterium]
MISGSKKLISVLSQFRPEGEIQKIIPILSGHIHRSYQVLTGESGNRQYFLQQINRHVFQNVPHLMENLERIISHLHKKQSAERERPVPSLIVSPDGTSFVVDDEGDFWRLFHFIPNSHVLDRVRTPEEAYVIGQSFGEFLNRMADFPAPPLHDTIPDFHGFGNRLDTYRNVLKRDAFKRAGQVQSEIEWIETILPLMAAWESLFENINIPSRITHNDTKWNNVLFDDNNMPICVIDLDTVMQGRIAYDFGDAVRTSCNTGQEDEPQLEKVGLDLTLFQSFTKGYLGPIRSILTEVELDTLIFAAQRMTFIIGLRFFTDYLDGDTYYHVKHEGHNLIRSRAQFHLFKSLQSHSQEIEETILSIWEGQDVPV